MAPEQPYEQPRYTLPTLYLAIVWASMAVLAAVATLVLAPRWGVSPLEASGALQGSLLAIVVGAAGVLLIRPWKPRDSGDLPTAWLLVTVLRLFAAPACAVLLYFAARPPMGPYVIGIGSAFIALLFFETLVIVFDMRRQFDQEGAPSNHRES